MRLVNVDGGAVTMFIIPAGEAMPMTIGVTGKSITTPTGRTRLVTDKFGIVGQSNHSKGMLV